MTMSEQRTLRKLRDKLRHDATLLVDGVSMEIQRDDGFVIRQQIPGLVRQLDAAIGHGREQRRFIRSMKGTSIGISVRAFDIMANIDNVTKQWSRSRSVPTRISSTVSALCIRSVEALPDMRYVSRYLESWVNLITEMFDPPRRFHLAAACPECGERVVKLYHMDDSEHVLAPALQITRTGNGHVCECFACGTQWPDTHFLLLAQILGCESVV